jgi:hypothetical protein
VGVLLNWVVSYFNLQVLFNYVHKQRARP